MIWWWISLSAFIVLIGMLAFVAGYKFGVDERDFWKEQYERELFFGKYEHE